MSSLEFSQYDTIGTDYDMVKEIPHNLIEKHNIKKTVEPFLKNKKAHVIDFACGTGFYSYHLLEWTAAKVVGIDLSETMVEAAKDRLAKTPFAHQAQFYHGDGAVASIYGDGNFDMATGWWFLNYAKDVDEMTDMFRTISMNLSPDGVFIGCCMPAEEDVTAAGLSLSNKHYELSHVRCEYGNPFSNGQGCSVNVTIYPPNGSLDFENTVEMNAYHLKKSIHEISARRGGMLGKFEWLELEVLDEWAPAFGVTLQDERWKNYKKHPQMSIIVVHKS